MENNNLVLGIDVGITSVGWGIVKTRSEGPTDYLIVDHGVRLLKKQN